MSSGKKRIGRPPVMSSEERKASILHAAETLFIQNGYGSITMNDIAKECGISKKTLYKFFSGKEKLLKSLLAHTPSVTFNLDKTDGKEIPIEKRLYQLFHELVRFALSPQQREVTRLAFSEAKNNPEVGQKFFNECILSTQKIFAEELLEYFDDDTTEEECLRNADMLIGAVIASLQFKSLLMEEDMDTLFKEADIRIRFLSKYFLKKK